MSQKRESEADDDDDISHHVFKHTRTQLSSKEKGVVAGRCETKSLATVIVVSDQCNSEDHPMQLQPSLFKKKENIPG